MTSTSALLAQRLREMERELNPNPVRRGARPAAAPAEKPAASQRPLRVKIERGMNSAAWRDGVADLQRQIRRGVRVNLGWIPQR